MLPDARDLETRKADALRLLTTDAVDVWVATASASGAPYLVPVSLAWAGERALIAVPASSLTARNLTASGAARLGVGPTRDVVMIDAVLESDGEVPDDVLSENLLGLSYLSRLKRFEFAGGKLVLEQ